MSQYTRIDDPEEGDELVKQEMSGCTKIAISKVETECIFWIRATYLDLDRVMKLPAEVGGAVVSYVVNEEDLADK